MRKIVCLFLVVVLVTVLTGCSLLRERVPAKVVSVKGNHWVSDTMYLGFESEALANNDTDAFVFWHGANEMNGHREYYVVIEFDNGTQTTVSLDYQPSVGDVVMY